ncbi:MAG: hypothetical protein F2840_02190 [Actinobacteria bacterium]|uniref:Unannotated protein n=1 Tax=freshwater metagenome TaxID=449393 RepID=A0A6J7IT09_9ZZZZ|nr:hypothetical protein [Actinomycetota bacterium]
MTLDALQPDAAAALEEARARAADLVGPELMSMVRDRISATLANAPPSRDRAPLSAMDADCIALVDQMLIDVSATTDAQVAAAGRHFASGGLSDFVTAAYLTEASVRLEIASTRLLGTPR